MVHKDPDPSIFVIAMTQLRSQYPVIGSANDVKRVSIKKENCRRIIVFSWPNCVSDSANEWVKHLIGEENIDIVVIFEVDPTLRSERTAEQYCFRTVPY